MSIPQSDAKRFFVERVIAQAAADQVHLSDTEREMLWWSETDPDVALDPELPSRLAAEGTDENYERKITGLLARALESDEPLDPGARAKWKRAFDTLRQGDHYILIMVDAAVGRRLTPWWKPRL